jgi:hypothetical protein
MTCFRVRRKDWTYWCGQARSQARQGDQSGEEDETEPRASAEHHFALKLAAGEHVQSFRKRFLTPIYTPEPLSHLEGLLTHSNIAKRDNVVAFGGPSASISHDTLPKCQGMLLM